MMTESKIENAKVARFQEEEVVLSVQGVSKKFCRDLKQSLLYGVQDIATELVGIKQEKNKLRSGEFWALNNVSFEVRRGQAIGLVGKNGSGKTTVLRIIAGLIKPDMGAVTIKGQIAPLIALGAGFNPILTGRENVQANMSILGLSNQQIKERFDSVVEFAEIGDAIDAPVQSYSSGMAARLGFASAIHTEPDILLIDEVLAVGDIRFRQKCFQRLQKLREKGTSFILVSHDPQAILLACDSAVYLSKGNLIASGDTVSIMQQYEEDLFLNETKNNLEENNFLKSPTQEFSDVQIISLFFRDENENIIDQPLTGELNYFCVKYNSSKKIDNAGLIVEIKEIGGRSNITSLISSFNDKEPLTIEIGEHEIRIKLPYLVLVPGLYSMRVMLRKDSMNTLDFVESFKFAVKSKTLIGRSSIYQAHSWEIPSA